MSEQNTGRTVYFTYDPENPPEMTEEERQRFHSLRDEDIDLSDIPEQSGLVKRTRPEWFGGSAAITRMAGPDQNVLILDERVVEGFRQMGDTSAQKMNAVLLDYLALQRKSA